MNPWIVRIVLVILALEAGICVAFLADELPPLRHGEEAVFHTILTKIRDGKEFVLDESQPVSRVRIVRPLVKGALQPYYEVGVTDDPESVLQSYPPSPIDWALLLRNMRTVGCKVAAIEQPLTWEDGVEWELNGVDNALGQFDTVVLTVDLRRVPSTQPIPGYLRRSAIPISNVRGNLGNIPRVNKVVHPPSAFGTGTTIFSFRLQEAEEGINSAVARWGDYLIPSFPLAVAMAQHRIPPDKVIVEPGHHIRLGDGPIIPIDEFGQMRFDLIKKPNNPYIDADLIVTRSKIPEAKAEINASMPRCALFTDARTKTPSPWSTNARLLKLMNSVDVLPRPGKPVFHQRLPVIGEIALLGLIAVVAGLLVGVRGLYRLLAFALIIIAAFATISLLLGTAQKWTLITPVIATALAGWFLCLRLARYMPRKAIAGASSE